MTLPDKIEPQDIESERALLATCFADQSVDRIADNISGEEFFRTAHQEIYEAMLEVDKKGARVESYAVMTILESRGTLENCGGFAYLMNLMQHDGAITPSNGVFYASRVRRAAQRRALLRAGSEIISIAYDDEAELEDAISRAEGSLGSAVDRDTDNETCVDGQQLSRAVLSEIERDVARGGSQRGMFTGMPDLDYTLGGLLPGELVIIAARTSMGKTALALSIMRNLILIGKRVVYFSLEMPRKSIMHRLYAIEAGVSMTQLANAALSREDLERTRKAGDRFDGCKFFVDDRAGVTPEYVRRVTRRLIARAPLSCVFVDHLHLMRTTQRYEKTVERWGEISQQLKILARDLNVPVVTLAQFSRGPEQRQDKTPQMSDLRESGRIEEDADKIISIFRPSYYKPKEINGTDKREPDDDVRLHVVKNRNGPTGSVPIRFHEATGFFENLDKERIPPPVIAPRSTAQPTLGSDTTAAAWPTEAEALRAKFGDDPFSDEQERFFSGMRSGE